MCDGLRETGAMVGRGAPRMDERNLEFAKNLICRLFVVVQPTRKDEPAFGFTGEGMLSILQ